MSRLKRAKTAVVLACLTFTASVVSAASDPAVLSAIKRHVAANEISGAIVVIDRKRHPVTTDVVGSSELKDGVPLAADSVVWVASMTKPVVATAVMMMVEAGKIDLDDPASRFIPAFGRTPMVRTPKPGFQFGVSGRPDPKGPAVQYDLAPAKRPLLVRDLLTMTAGLQTIGIPNADLAKITPDDTLASWVPKAADAPLDFEPGSRWAYSNATEFEVLARIVEVVSGMPFDRFVQQRIFDPLAMHDTSFGPRMKLKSRTLPLGLMATNPIMMGRFSSGSAGLLTTAGDYAHFAAMLRDMGAYKGRRLLKSSTVRLMASNQIGEASLAGIGPGDYMGLQTKVMPGLKYGYGVAVITNGPTTGLSLPTGAFGWDGVGTRRMWVVPSRKVAIVMLVPAAAGLSGAEPMHREIEAIVMAETTSR